MLESLKLHNVGPAATMELELASRINVITGDNGLGKSFLLDIIWWALTRRWPAEVNPKLTSGLMARPASKGTAAIEFVFRGKTKKQHFLCTYERRAEAWNGRSSRPVDPGLVLYAQVDGGFAVWDPARNYPQEERSESHGPQRPPAFVFSPQEVWDGLKAGDTQVCNGLLMDWALWQKEGGIGYERFCKALGAISPSSEETLVPGELGTLRVGDARWIPTLKTPYRQDVLIVHASAAVKRMVSLVYLLIWSWQEHLRAARVLDEEPTQQITFLIDEIESHLHPRWQRTIARSLLEVMAGLAANAQTQLIVATHSPLLLASLEPLFDPERDAWFDLDLEDRSSNAPQIILRRREYVRRGDVSNWLTSEAFDLKVARSLEAESAIEKARELLRRRDAPTLQEATAIDHELRVAALPDIDPFWVRWSAFLENLAEQR